MLQILWPVPWRLPGLRLTSFLPVLVPALLLTAATARAGDSSQAKILVHLVSPVARNDCALRSTPPGCGQIETRGQVGDSCFAHVIATGITAGVGMSGAQSGVACDDALNQGVIVFSWTSCDDVRSPSTGWPASECGTLILRGNSDGHPPAVRGCAIGRVDCLQLSVDGAIRGGRPRGSEGLPACRLNGTTALASGQSDSHHGVGPREVRRPAAGTLSATARSRVPSGSRRSSAPRAPGPSSSAMGNWPDPRKGAGALPSTCPRSPAWSLWGSRSLVRVDSRLRLRLNLRGGRMCD